MGDVLVCFMFRFVEAACEIMVLKDFLWMSLPSLPQIPPWLHILTVSFCIHNILAHIVCIF